MKLFDKLKIGLEKTRNNIAQKVDEILISFGKIDDDLFDSLEEVLILSDIGVETSMKIIEELKTAVKEKVITRPDDIRELLKEKICDILFDEAAYLDTTAKPTVILILGVNGVGKTTSIGKIAYLLKSQGKKVMLAAGDTFRAAAIDQLEIWAERAGADFVKHSLGSDSSAVIFDAIHAAKARGVDVLICDTAGRIHTKKNLMEELKKLSRVIERESPGALREVLLVIDATTGQNGIQQAKVFRETSNITGIILTKLDGTAKGGIVVSIKAELGIPVKMIGIGEGIDDLQPFDPKEFAEALF